MRPWSTTSTLNEFSGLCCGQPHLRLLSDPESVSLTQRMSGIGPLAISELLVGSEMSLDAGETCGAYRLNLLRCGRAQSFHGRESITAGGGAIVVHPPEGQVLARWAAGSRLVAVKIDRGAVEEALSDVLGRQLRTQIAFRPIVNTMTAAAVSWLNMVLMFTDQLFAPGSLVMRPLVGLPIVDSIVRGLLLVADHPHRDAVVAGPKSIAPRAVRAATELIEADPQAPWTVSKLASGAHVSVRCLQQGFRDHMGTSPMAYLREVRLRHAHKALERFDPSVTSVASIACEWGFTNLGRFAAAHAARYGEPPAVTLRKMR